MVLLKIILLVCELILWKEYHGLDNHEQSIVLKQIITHFGSWNFVKIKSCS
jgi:hypothetical protein